MLTITINSVDKTNDIAKESLQFQQNLSKQPSTLSFAVVGNKTPLELGATVVLTENGEDIFSGTITERTAQATGGLHVTYQYNAMDGYYQLDRKLVSKAYTDTTVKAILEDIIANYVTGITLDIVDDTPAIKTARFNYEQPSRAIQKIANQVGWDWYIDADNVLHFFAAETNDAPVEITDDNGNAIANSLQFESNIIELKNAIYIRGGEYLDEVLEVDAIDRYEADGEQLAFPIVYRYNSVEVTLDGTPLDVGVDFIDDPAEHDVLYNFQEKLIRFREDNKPTAGQVVRVFGNRYIPLIMRVEDEDSITTYGERETVEINKTINSIQEAELLGAALLEKWREGSQEGSFRTKVTGLRVGQSIRITSARFGIDRVYKINSLTGNVKHHDELEYSVSFIVSGQTTFTDIMIGLIGRDNENIEISPDEVIQLYRNLKDDFTLEDEITEVTKETGPYAWSPVTTNKAGQWNFFTWS